MLIRILMLAVFLGLAACTSPVGTSGATTTPDHAGGAGGGGGGGY